MSYDFTHLFDFEAVGKDIAEHEALCTGPCERCRRYKCSDCDVLVASAGPYGVCPSCAVARQEKEKAGLWRDLVSPAHEHASFEASWLRTLVGHSFAESVSRLQSKRVTFVGDPGSGKTSLAVALLRRDLSGLKRPMVIAAHALAKARSLHPLGAGEAPDISYALSCDFLLLDELGGVATQHSHVLSEVIHHRFANELQTVITTGLKAGDIAARYGGGILRRVTEGAAVIKCGKQPS